MVAQTLFNHFNFYNIVHTFSTRARMEYLLVYKCSLQPLEGALIILVEHPCSMFWVRKEIKCFIGHNWRWAHCGLYNFPPQNFAMQLHSLSPVHIIFSVCGSLRNPALIVTFVDRIFLLKGRPAKDKIVTVVVFLLSFISFSKCCSCWVCCC